MSPPAEGERGRRTVLALAVLAVVVAGVAGEGSRAGPGGGAVPPPPAGPGGGGASPRTRGVCSRLPADTHASKTPGDNGFRIKVAGTSAGDRYTPGQVYTVTINGTYPNQRLLGFMLVAVPDNAEDETTTMGTFQNFNHGLTQLAADCPHVVTHTYQYAKAGVEVLWTAPPTGAGCVEFRATVIEYKDIWYKDDGALTRRFCEHVAVANDEGAPEVVPECCACGTGKYQMTFHGEWSRQSHPKDYPTHKRLLHWSNIVGASHSRGYTIWKYGGYSSKGVKEVCEFGYPRTLEQEMRHHSRDIRTVVKTPGIWYSEPHGLIQTRWARFSVDSRNHLLTMITMLGPSPDWCVGVSALNLCLPNCTWAGDMSIDLYPWDAGTDDGVTYMSRNMKSDPQQKIHRISNTFPKNPASPFFGQSSMLPLARLTLRRIHPKPGDTITCYGNETDPEITRESPRFETSDDDALLTDMEKKKLMMMKSGKCGLSEWGDWSGCSTTCGVGQRFRKRMFVNPMMTEDMCGVSLMETENCIGIENECEKIGDDCAVTAWSDWSPCSVTCGKGIRERRRYYLNKMDMKRCTRTTDDSEMCISKIMDCEAARASKNFTAICALPVKVGPCRGRFSRWYYDVTMGKCLQFTYGGCRGNNNRFRSAEECRSMCEQHMNRDTEESSSRKKDRTNKRDRAGHTGNQHRQNNRNRNRNQGGGAPPEPQGDRNSETVDCMVTPWSEYSECSATCGKAYRYKRRMIKREPENGGKSCPKKLERKKRCKLPKCARDCQLGPWSDWSQCGKTCGLDSIQERSRPIVRPPQRGGQACQPRLERRYCPLPACSGEEEMMSKEERMRKLTDVHQREGR